MRNCFHVPRSLIVYKSTVVSIIGWLDPDLMLTQTAVRQYHHQHNSLNTSCSWKMTPVLSCVTNHTKKLFELNVSHPHPLSCVHNSTNYWITGYLITLNNKVHALGHLYYDGFIYHQTSSISRTLGNKLADHTDTVGASPIGAAPSASSLST